MFARDCEKGKKLWKIQYSVISINGSFLACNTVHCKVQQLSTCLLGDDVRPSYCTYDKDRRFLSNNGTYTILHCVKTQKTAMNVPIPT
jgi:hypothetical protein